MVLWRRSALHQLQNSIQARGLTGSFHRSKPIASTAGSDDRAKSSMSRKASPDGRSIQAFRPKKVLVLSKITRYEFEKQKQSPLTDEELAEALAKKGSNLATLKKYHDFHKEQAHNIVKSLTERKIEAHIVNRYEYGPETVKWADAIITAGGDGTFLLGASMVKDARVPIIGVNTDPRRSEGYLCLPKEDSLSFPASLDKLLDQQFRWAYRQRIRVELSGPHAMEAPVELHEQELDFPRHKFADFAVDLDDKNEEPSSKDNATSTAPGTSSQETFSRVLPECALNEVFIGESLSSRVSYYEITVDNYPAQKQKSSGVAICTGTGSRSWAFNINKLTKQATASIINIIRETSLLPIPSEDEYIEMITSRFNDKLLFDPSDERMVYTVRDPVSNRVYGAENPRGYAQRVTIKSRCSDASLVIDGGSSYKFNDGATAVFTINPEDALRTVQLL
ncbi:hypothetical protein RvY_08112 [Ramazzottius varieornatus]|uniref:NAD(+) kinase n=1 Tax=Ramazzottius varieornatus TaxID=947166 RepID=A0A1D1V7F4_RAMVA|nr:hypothetical protein RvY_08112 [Ramazzottius varieornatus]